MNSTPDVPSPTPDPWGPRLGLGVSEPARPALHSRSRGPLQRRGQHPGFGGRTQHQLSEWVTHVLQIRNISKLTELFVGLRQAQSSLAFPASLSI